MVIRLQMMHNFSVINWSILIFSPITDTKIRSLFSTLLLVLLASSFAFANSVSSWKPLLAANELGQILQAHSKAVTITDIRQPNTPDPDSSYNASHIADASSSPCGNWWGPAKNPRKFLSQSQLTTLVQGLGLTAGTPTIVIHKGDSCSDFGAAARVYWTLKTAGLRQLAVVDGGFIAWEQTGLPISKEVTKASHSS